MGKLPSDEHCDNSGRCVVCEDHRANGVANCIYCGKELIWLAQGWYTHDAIAVYDPQPQDEVSRTALAKDRTP